MTEKLDQDQQHNANALAAIGVEYPIEKRFVITESQLWAVNEAISDAASFYEVFDDDNYCRGEIIRRGEAATENLDPAGGCEHWQDGPCECRCWLCTKYKAANGS